MFQNKKQTQSISRAFSKRKKFLRTAIVVAVFLFSLVGVYQIYQVNAASVVSTQSGDWHTASTWGGGPIPTAGDDVTIAAGHTVTFTSDIAEVADIDISGTLTQNNSNPQTITGDLTIFSGGKLTHSDNSTAQSYILDFSANNVDIQTGGSIDVDGLGYSGGYYNSLDDYNDNGFGPAGGYGRKNYGAGGGGAHGGDGGYSGKTGTDGGTAYCNATNPSTIGAGGARGSGDGGDGGGLVTLDVTDTITIDGTITALGGNGGAYAGGGGGGGVNLVAGTVSGNPDSNINITGGSGAFGGWGGGGGGGCVYIGYTASNIIESSDISLLGGVGSHDNGDDGTFNTALLAPSSPTSLQVHSTDAQTGNTPSDIESLTPHFSAVCNSAVGDCSHYAIQVDNDSDFSSPTLWNYLATDGEYSDVSNGSRGSDITYAGNALSYDTTYHWRVRYYIADGTAGLWSAGGTFYLPRSLELLNFNYGGSVEQGQDIDVSWMSLDGVSGETVKLEYSTNAFADESETIEISASESFPSSATNINTYSWTIPDVSGVCGDPCTTVKVRLSSNNDNNYETVSEQNFTIQSAFASGIRSGHTFDDDDYFTLSDPSISFSGGDVNIAADDWYNTSWDKRKKITFTSDALKIPSAQTDFPVLINLTTDSDLASDAQADFDDILFTSSDKTTKLSHEIESYDSETGKLVAWVKVSSLAVSGEIYMYYGNSGASNQEDSDNVWDSNYLLVHHFEDTSPFDDSTSNNNNSSSSGTVNAAQTGKIGDAITTASGNSKTTSGSGLAISGTGNRSVEMWFKANSDTGTIFKLGHNSRHSGVFSPYLGGNNQVCFWGNYNDFCTGTNVAQTTWYHFVAEYNGTNVIMYLNGSSIYDSAKALNQVDNQPAVIGWGDWQGYLNATYDEFRVSNSVRSADWVTASYNNQNNPSTFYALASEETIGLLAGSYSITPKTPHTFTSLSDFSATSSTTGSAAVKYLLSPNNGTDWYYCAGSAAVKSLTEDYSDANEAGDIGNTCLANLGNLGTSTGQFLPRVYFSAGAGETATISDMSYLISNNNAPTTTAIAPSQTAGSDDVTFTTTVADLDSEITSLAVEYFTGNGVWSDATISSAIQAGGEGDGTILASGLISGIDTDNDGSIDLTITWDAGTDLTDTDDSTVYFRITPNDGNEDGTPQASAAFALDTQDPTASGNLTIDSTTSTAITYTLGIAGSDTNLDNYKIYYKQAASGVTEADSLHDTIASGAYTPGSTTQIPSLSPNTQYTTNIWIYDSFSHSSSATEVVKYTAANAPGTPALSNVTTNSLDITLDANSNPTITTFAIRINDGATDQYLQADGSLGVGEVWQDEATWGTVTATGLTPDTTYTVDTKARNGDSEDTNFGTQSSTTTPALPGSPTILINSGAVYTNSTNIDLSLSATNAAEMYITGDITTVPSWIPYSTTYNLPLTVSEGTKTIFIKFRDQFNNETSTVSDDITLDTTTATTSVDPAAGTYDDPQTVTLTCADTLSGCNRTYYTTDGSDPTTTSNVYASPLTIGTTTTIKYFSTDNAGNEETIRTTEYTINGLASDHTAPTLSGFTPAKGATKISTKTTISFVVSEEDGGSGIDLNSLATTITGSKTGTHTDVFTAYSGDSSQYDIMLAPTLDFAKGEEVTVTVEVSDNASNTTTLTDYVFLIQPASEPGTRDDSDDSTAPTVTRAKTSKAEADLEAERAQGIIDDGANIKVTDLTYDGTKEIVVASKSGAPYIYIYSKDGILLTPPFLAYEKTYTKGVNLEVADIDGTSQQQEIITSPMDGSAHINIFDHEGNKISSFMARGDTFRGNTIVKAANLEGSDTRSGDLELIVLCSDGVLKVFNKQGQEIMPASQVFLPYLQSNLASSPTTDNQTTTNSAGDTSSTLDPSTILFDLEVTDLDNDSTNNNGAKEIIVSDHNSIMIYGKDNTTNKLKQITPDIVPHQGTDDYNQGIVLSTGDLDGTQGELELVIGSKTGSSTVKVFNKDGQELQPAFYAYDPHYQGGIDLEVSDLDGTNKAAEIITIAQNYSSHVRIFNKEGTPITSGFMAFPEYNNGHSTITAIDIDSNQDQIKKSLLISPTKGSTQNRLFSKDSKLLSPGWYMIGLGEEVE